MNPIVLPVMIATALAACSQGAPLMNSPQNPPVSDLDEQPTSIGIATMEANGDIVLRLRAPLGDDPSEGFGEGYFRYSPGTADYQNVLDHVGGLKPGESKPAPPWPEAGDDD